MAAERSAGDCSSGRGAGWRTGETVLGAVLGAVLVSPLVSARWLRAHLDEVRMVDVRWYLNPPAPARAESAEGAVPGSGAASRNTTSDAVVARSGRDAWRAGHIPGAVWLDIDTDLSAPASAETGRHPLPSPQHFAAALGAAGIAEGTPVVAYDDAGGSTAARLWWLLHALGEPVAVLDGGIAAWLAAGGELVAEVPGGAGVPGGDGVSGTAGFPGGAGAPGTVGVGAVPRRARPWPPGRFVTADQLADSSAMIFDARSAQRYEHGDPAIDPRPGHIPGAVSAPWTGNLDADGTFLPATVLAQRFAAASRGAIVYCGSGVTACHDLLAMTVAGYTDIALYPGSWSQWGADPARPAETD